ncbi:MAG: RNA methyltransferase substrate-binding domain-containing protein [Polyangiaceae bacterium]
MSRIVCGLQPVREAIRVHGAKLERVLVEAGTQKGRELDALARYATDHGAKVERVGRGDLDRVSRGIKHQGVIAFAPELDVLRLSDVTFGPNDIVVALDELEDPQNFGAVIRSSVALGVNLVVWPEHHWPP